MVFHWRLYPYQDEGFLNKEASALFVAIGGFGRCDYFWVYHFVFDFGSNCSEGERQVMD